MITYQARWQVGRRCTDLHELSPKGSQRLSLLRPSTQAETHPLWKSPKSPAGHLSCTEQHNDMWSVQGGSVGGQS